MTGTMGSYQNHSWWPSKVQNWTYIHSTWLKPPGLEQGQASQMCFWHWEGLTQACTAQELLTHTYPWTGKSFRPYSIFLPILHQPLPFISPCAPLRATDVPLVSQFKAVVCRAGRMICIFPALIQLQTRTFGSSAP